MRLRTRTLVSVGLIMSALFVLLFGGAYHVLTQRYVEMERREAVTAAIRTADVVSSEVVRLDTTALSWSARDDTYAYMERREAPPLIHDLSDESLAHEGVGFVVFLDESGKTVHACETDLDLEIRQPAGPELTAAIEAATFLRIPGDPRSEVKGLMKLPKGPAVVAARPITTGDMYASPNGYLVLGRYIDDHAVQAFSAAVGMTISAHPVPARVPESAVTTTAAEDVLKRLIWWRPYDDDTIYTYALIDDVMGEPVVLMRASLTRETRAGLRSAIAFAGLSLFIVCVAATVSVLFTLNRTVIAPIGDLTGQVRDIARKGDSAARVKGMGADELGTLADNVNGMLASLEAAEYEMRRAREDLERRVEDRTRELHVSDARHRELIERMADAVFSVDLDGRITLVNSRAVEMMGRSRDELLGSRFADLFTPGSVAPVEHVMRDTPRSDDLWTVEALLDSAGREPIPVELRAAVFHDDEGQVAGTQWIARDVTDRQRFEQQLIHLATHDALTGLANRRAFETALEIELAEAARGEATGAVIWLDLDDFKDLNDTLGHAAGDEALVMLSGVLDRNIRSSNLLARVGGDEFAVLVPNVTREEAQSAAERILSAITSYTCVVAAHSVRFGASLGVVFYPENGLTVQEVLSNADAAMYIAKERGRATVHVTDVIDQGEQLHVSRMAWNDRITMALQHDAFVVHAQPILDLRSGEVVRHELLIRMCDDDGVTHSPPDFLPVAERLGLITEIDRWMIRHAVALLQTREFGIDNVEVNLSGKALVDAHMVKLISTELERSGIDPRRIGFEITETAAIGDMSRAQWFIRSLKEMGCRFSLDDFGTGFSSFYYLKHLPVDCLKIDGSYVRGLAQSEQDRCLVRGIIEMCRGLDIEVLAECVEDEDALQAVRGLGLDYAQGYFIGRPAEIHVSGCVER